MKARKPKNRNGNIRMENEYFPILFMALLAMAG
jgi:hypothetical protein